eukprot:scaffold310061_cov32-Tisochrysis_lutea.AAC.2
MVRLCTKSAWPSRVTDRLIGRLSDPVGYRAHDVHAAWRNACKPAIVGWNYVARFHLVPFRTQLSRR